MTIVAILSVRTDAVETFREFERHAASIMTRHGGRIERCVVIPPAAGESLLREIHVVTFPDAEAFETYRRDEDLAAIAHLRAESVVATEMLVGHDGPAYHRDV